MLSTLSLNGCLTGEQAAATLILLVEGEKGSRYYKQGSEAYGYFFEPALQQWVAFDNRTGTCFIQTYKNENSAKEALLDGNELLFN